MSGVSSVGRTLSFQVRGHRFEPDTPLQLRGFMNKNVLTGLMKEANKLGKISNICVKNFSNADITEEDAIKLEDQIGKLFAHIRLVIEEGRLRENSVFNQAEDSYAELINKSAPQALK